MRALRVKKCLRVSEGVAVRESRAETASTLKKVVCDKTHNAIRGAVRSS